MSTCYNDVQSKKIKLNQSYGSQVTLIGQSNLRIINNIIDSPSYSIYINNNKTWNHIHYKTISNFKELNTGNQYISIKNKDDVLIDFNVLLLAGITYSIILTGEQDKIVPLLLDDTIECEGNQYIYIRFIHGVYNVPSINIKIDDELFENFNYKDSHVLKIEKKSNINTDTIHLSLINKKYKFNTYPMYVKYGSIYTVVLTGTLEHLFILTKEDEQRHCYKQNV